MAYYTVRRKDLATNYFNSYTRIMFSICVVTPNVLWRGARPDKDGAAWLIQQGVRTIVNLELILDDKRAFGDATVEDANNYEVGYFRIHDWEPLRILAPSIVDDQFPRDCQSAAEASLCPLSLWRESDRCNGCRLQGAY